MKIRLIPTDHGWRADPEWLPGTPPNGFGKTREEAVGELFLALAWENRWGFSLEELPSPKKNLRDLAGDYYLYPDDDSDSRLKKLIEAVTDYLREESFATQDVTASYDSVISFSTGDELIFQGDPS